ncbi:MAG: hypothetical protein ACOYOB_16820 [Myxococcota bacterium]
MNPALRLIADALWLLLQAHVHCQFPLYGPADPRMARDLAEAVPDRGEQRRYELKPDDVALHAVYDPDHCLWLWADFRAIRAPLGLADPRLLASLTGRRSVKVRQGARLDRPFAPGESLLPIGRLDPASAAFSDLWYLSRRERAKSEWFQPERVRWRHWRGRTAAMEGVALWDTGARLLVLSTIQMDWLGGSDNHTSRYLRPLDKFPSVQISPFNGGRPAYDAFDPAIHPATYPRSQAVVVAWVSKQDILPSTALGPIPNDDLREYDGKLHDPIVSCGPCAEVRSTRETCTWSGVCRLGPGEPILRSWVPSGTPLFSLDGTWFGFARGLFLLGREVVSPNPLLACHETYYSVLQVVCVPTFLRAPRCGRGW